MRALVQEGARAQATSLGALLLRIRKRAELTQEALAARAGVSVSTISNLEAGRGHLPRQVTLDLLADVLATALAPAERPRLRADLRDAARASREQRQSAGTPGPLTPPAAPATAPLPSGTLTFLVCVPAPASVPPLEHAPSPQAALPQLAAVLQRVLRRHGGRLVDPLDGPDGAVCAFARAPDAVAAASALQHVLRERALPVCLALHTGWAEPGEGDYAGPSRRHAVRLARLGHPGQALLTQATRDLVHAGLPEGTGLRGVGRHSLSAVERPQPIYQLLPAAQSAAVASLGTPPAPPTNLPVQLTSFVGREREVAALEGLLGRAALVTLTGAGGCGKTRLAIQLAAEMLDGYRDGVWLVELASLADPALVPGAVAGALGLREEPGRPILQTLTDHLQEKHLLLVLDNCEQLRAACAALASALLPRCPHLQALATSRERLSVGGEAAYAVPPLAVPPPDVWPAATLAAYEGVRLFMARAQASRPGFALDEGNAAAVAAICRRLGGSPLAIELAAAQVAGLPVGEIAARLERGLGVLTGGPWDAPARQQTLRAALDWSHDLLGEPERALFRRLSVFAGGWALGAAEAVCGGPGLEAWPVAGLLGGLVGKSLAGLQEGDGAGRYTLLEPVRQYAAERLEERGEERATRAAHAAYFLEVAEEAERQFYVGRAAASLALLEAEHDNMRAALGWTLRDGDPQQGVRLVGALYRFWEVRGHLAEGQRWLDAILAREGELGPGAEVLTARALGKAFPAMSGAQSPWGRVLAGASVLAWRRGDDEQAMRWCEQRLTLSRELGDAVGIVGALNDQGINATQRGDLARSVGYFEQCLKLVRDRGDVGMVASALGNLGGALRRLGEYERAEVLLEEARVLLSQAEIDQPSVMADVLWELATLAARREDVGRALHLYRDCGALLRDMGNKVVLPGWFEALATLAGRQGQAEHAVRLFGVAAALREAVGSPLSPEETIEVEGAMGGSRAALGDEAWDRTWAAGRAMPLDEAIVLALEGQEKAPAGE